MVKINEDEVGQQLIINKNPHNKQVMLQLPNDYIILGIPEILEIAEILIQVLREFTKE